MGKRRYMILILISCSLLGYAQSKNFIDQPYIETTAQVDTLVTPDRIYLNILITEKDTKGKTSVEELESKMEATLKNMGINTKEGLALNDLISNFKKYFLKQQDVLKSKSYTLLVKDAQSAGRIMIALENLEISNVKIDRTEYSRIDQLRLALKSKAIRKAQHQVKYLTDPLNQKIGSAIFISDQSNYSRMNNLQGRAAGVQIRGYSSMAQKEFKPADIEFEKIKVESVVNVKFVLEQ